MILIRHFNNFINKTSFHLAVSTHISYDSFESEIESLPEFLELGSRLNLVGYLKAVPCKRARSHAASIESILADSFANSRARRIEVLHHEYSGGPSLYETFFYSCRNSRLEFHAGLDYGNPTEQELLRFFADFPFKTKTQKENTKKAISGIWPHIEYIEFSDPGKYNSEFMPGAIELTHKGKIISQGQPALKKIGLSLPEKHILITSAFDGIFYGT